MGSPTLTPIFKTALAAASKNIKERLVGTLTPTVFPSTQRFDLPSQFVMTGFRLSVNATLDVSAGAADGVLAAEQPMSLLRNLRIRSSSNSRPAMSGDFVNGDGPGVYQKDHFLNGNPGPIVALAASGIQAASPMYISVELPYELLHTKLPRSVMINGTELNAHELIVEWADVEELIVGGDRTKVLSAVSMDIWAKEFLDPTMTSQRFAAMFQPYIEKPVLATQSRMVVNVNSNRVVRGWLICQFTRTVHAKTPVITVINGVSVETEREKRKEFVGATGSGFAEIQMINARRLGLAAIPTGYCFLDLSPDGEMDDLIDMAPFDAVNLVFDVTFVADSFIRIYPIEILDRHL